MKRCELIIDFRNHLEILQKLKIISAKEGISEKEIVIRALFQYLNSCSFMKIGEEVFADWDNEVDSIYDAL